MPRNFFFLPDLKAIELPWIDRLVSECKSHEDLAAVWTLICCWGSDEEDVETIFRLSTYFSRLQGEGEKTPETDPFDRELAPLNR